MEGVKVICGADTECEQQKLDKENFDRFMNAMAQIVEKYAQSVLQELDQVA